MVAPAAFTAIVLENAPRRPRTTALPFKEANASRAWPWGRNRKIVSELIDRDACRSASLRTSSTGWRVSRRALPSLRCWHRFGVRPRSALGRWQVQTRAAGQTARDLYRPGRSQPDPDDRLGQHTRTVASDK